MNSNILDDFFALADEKYKDFTKSLIPNVQEERIIGVRIPDVRKLAKRYKDDEDEFMKNLPHSYHEENMLHAIFISGIRDFDLCIEELALFLPHVDNWAVCDSIRPRSFNSNKERLIKIIKSYLSSNHVYTVRFGIEMLMIHFIREDFSKDHLYAIANIKHCDYYVKMAVAWYFATALAFHYDETLAFLQIKRLSRWCHNKTIQKARESFRISSENKTYLQTLKY